VKTPWRVDAEKMLYNDAGKNMPPNDPFPRSEFDDWAETYDLSVSDDQFPFTGYKILLKKIVILADIKPRMRILDLGSGTGNLALHFVPLDCDLWCTDFSASMLEKAHQKIPNAHFVLSDLRGDWPPELNHPFDRIVSAYVFHHFDLDQKIQILGKLIPHLEPTGRIIIGDIAFPDARRLETIKVRVGDLWEDEFYWLADEAIPALENCGFKVEYKQVSTCAGIFKLKA
jgi:putative AdoMet-dependent methyltransferase